VLRLEPRDPAIGGNLRYMQASGRAPRMPQALPLFKPPYSRMTAIDMNRGEHAWMVPTGNGDRIRNLPPLAALHLPPVGGDTSYSGPLLTRTLLIYALTAGGRNDGPRLVAYDKGTGRELASADLPAIAIGTPMTYLLDGRQYIAVTVQAPETGLAPELVALRVP
jgi:quinoprotein glucose dehydrogenase